MRKKIKMIINKKIKIIIMINNNNNNKFKEGIGYILQ